MKYTYCFMLWWSVWFSYILIVCDIIIFDFECIRTHFSMILEKKEFTKLHLNRIPLYHFWGHLRNIEWKSNNNGQNSFVNQKKFCQNLASLPPRRVAYFLHGPTQFSCCIIIRFRWFMIFSLMIFPNKLIRPFNMFYISVRDQYRYNILLLKQS